MGTRKDEGSSPTLSHVSKVKVIRNEFVQEIRVLAHFLDALDIGHNHGNDRVIIQLLDDSRSEQCDRSEGQVDLSYKAGN